MLAIQRVDLVEKLLNRSCDMYLGAVQAPGLGKFCGQRTRVIKLFEKVQNFRKFRKIDEIDVHSAKSSISRERDIDFRGACP